MKKLRMLITLIILAFSFSVKAEVFIEIDCDGKEITSTKNVTCELNLIYEEVSINNIDLNYQTNLDIKFVPMNGFTISNSSNKVSLHTDEALYDEIMNSTVIMKFTLSSNSTSNETEKITFNNIKINNSNEEMIDDIEESFNIIISKETSQEEIKLDNVCTLDSIMIDSKKLSNFNKNVLEYYNLTVTEEVIYIDAVRTSNKSSATGLGAVRVPKGETIERDIVVTAEDGTKNIYKLFIKNTTPKETSTPTPNITITPDIKNNEEILPDKIEEKSSDNTLKKLELYNGKKKIDYIFDIKKDVFDIKLEEDIEKITIKAELNDNKASFVKDYGPRDVIIDSNDKGILIKVKAENGDEKLYKLVIHINKKDHDNTLLSLKINGKIVDLNQEKLEITLSSEIDKTIIEAIAKSEKATIKYEDKELVDGDNLVTITVTSEDGEIKEYLVNVIREKEEITVLEDKIIEEDIELPKEDNNSNIIYYIILGVMMVLVTTVIIYLTRKRKKNQIIEEI